METVEPEDIPTFLGGGSALDPWLLDGIPFCNRGSASSSWSMLLLPLLLHCEDDDGDGEEEKDGMDDMSRHPVSRL